MKLNYIFNNMEHQALVTFAIVCVIMITPILLIHENINKEDKNIIRNEIACNLWQNCFERTRLWCKAIPYIGTNKIGDNEFNIVNYLHLGLGNSLAYFKHINSLQG